MALTASREGQEPLAAPLVIVSNRGPKDFVWRDDQWLAMPATGGLVSMLAPLAERPDVRWFCCVSEPPDADAAGLFTTAADQTGGPLPVTPVPLPASVYHAYYGQISNEVLWMLQHLILGTRGFEAVDAQRHHAWTNGYLAANQQLAETIRSSCSDVRAFLIQDYHLYPLPALLRQRFPDTPILHFTHIPFPVPPRMRLLPGAWREVILRGLLGADVVGMQTRGDADAFLDCCRELLGCSVDREKLAVETDDGRLVRVRVYPASADPAELGHAMQSPAVAEARARMKDRMGRFNVIRVDRVDPSKNQVLGFRAFGRLLEMRPDLRATLRFSAFLVPSRTDLSVYQTYTDAIRATIREVNDRFETDCGAPPIEIYYTNDREQALAAMESCDVLLVNSLQDGMNLVAKEWAVVSKRPGVLVLSETAGVAGEAEQAALLVSPLDVEGTARAMSCALDMPDAERAARLERLRNRVCRWTAADWLSAQLSDLGIE
ncbi:MAG: trehalose-6-phosphate synthase [Chloroflexi bacterium]|nr:trehalose-6-phosphate synthase [Chloroflexota bacterium]